MSHFTVIVVGDDIDKQLERFNEQGEPGDYFMHAESEEVDLAEARDTLAYVLNERLAKDEDSDDLPAIDDDRAVANWYAGGGLVERDGLFFRTYYTNPDAQWDWYVVGGRWRGFFRVKPGTDPERYSLGDTSWASPETTHPLAADVAYKGDIDWEDMRLQAEAEANATYNRYEEVCDRTPEALTWEETLAKFVDEGTLDVPFDRDDARWEKRDQQVSQARRFYYDQPRIAALQEARLIGFMAGEEIYKVGREAFVHRARLNTAIPFAILKDGTWYEKGRMGWWGMSTDEMSDEEWAEGAIRMLDELPDDTLLTLVDCHI